MPEETFSPLMELPPEIFLTVISKLDNQSLAQLSLSSHQAEEKTREYLDKRLERQFAFEFPLEYSLSPVSSMKKDLLATREKAYQSLPEDEKKAFIALRKGIDPHLETAAKYAFVKDGQGYYCLNFVKNDELLNKLYYRLIKETKRSFSLLNLAIWCNKPLSENLTGEKVLNKEENGLTPIVLAVMLGRKQQLKTLLDRGALTGRSSSALSVASQIGDLDIIDMLIQKGAALDAEQGVDSALIYAVRHNQYLAAELLLARRANPNHSGAEGNTALHYAASLDNTKMIGLLAEHGARASLNAKGACPLSIAAEKRHVDAAQTLLTAEIPLLCKKSSRSVSNFIKHMANDSVPEKQQKNKSKAHSSRGRFSIWNCFSKKRKPSQKESRDEAPVIGR